jgi:hypothetical protein
VMCETCPSCQGHHLPDDPGALVQYAHTPTCRLAREEAEQLAADLARHRRRGRAVWHRPASPAERELLAATGVSIPSRTPAFCRVEWVGPDLRLRSWSRAGIVAVDEVSPRG